MADDARIDVRTAEEVIALWATPPARTIPDVPPNRPTRRRRGRRPGPPDHAAQRLRTDVDGVPPRPSRMASASSSRPAAAGASSPGKHEGVDLCHWLTERGYTAFLLKYRVTPTPADPAEFAAQEQRMIERVGLADRIPAAKAPRSLVDLIKSEGLALGRVVAHDDGTRALQLVRERAGEFGVKPDRIGMIGFSAGAFLAADVAMDPGGAPLAFVAPIYGGETGGKPVPADAPPLFTCIAQDDRILFKVVEGLYADWSNADRPAELHIFARGPHGFGMVRQDLPVDRWIDLFADWLDRPGLRLAFRSRGTRRSRRGTRGRSEGCSPARTRRRGRAPCRSRSSPAAQA